MELIDTHAHLDADAFSTDLDEVLANAKSASVSRIFSIGITLETSRRAVALAEQHAEVSAVVGIQPNYTAEASAGDMAEIVLLLSHPKVVGIGETGLDRYWDYAPFDVQIDYFRQHLELALQHQLPFIIHCRDAEDDVLNVLQEFAAHQPFAGVMHSFCGSSDSAKSCLEIGLHLSFSGMVTYRKNEELREIARTVPANRILIETDAPYLVPTPKRGKVKRNEPAYVEHTARCLAELRNLTLEDFAAQTTQNVLNLFGAKL